MEIQIYGKDDIDIIPVPKLPFSLAAYRYTVPIMRAGSKKYIANVDTDLRLLRADELYLPLTINDAQLENSYVCAPFTHYILYAEEELVRIPNAFLRRLFKIILAGLAIILRFGKINQVVAVNNWMLSTNLYPTLTEREISTITAYLAEQYPEHAIAWRSIQTYRQKDLRSFFKNERYLEVASRQVYLWDVTHPINQSPHAERDLKSDNKLLTDPDYSVEAVSHLTETSAKRVRELYDMLYLNKYSRYNPQFTELFFTHAVNSGVFDMTLFRKDSAIEGVLGLLPLEKMVTATIFGYNTALPATEKLYRRLSIFALDYARQRHWISHASSGAASFKRNRKYVSEVEYTMTYVRHLTFRQRFAWRLLSILITVIGVPLLRKYEL
jgi:hypothetical protein